ncbi:hypothetical protein GSU72_02735 [Rathayibacter sp. VKM Ac-2760]|nr:hypothetical protein GSU72_02735 [Rathayibacter sp. VKM Ac-2760]
MFTGVLLSGAGGASAPSATVGRVVGRGQALAVHLPAGPSSRGRAGVEWDGSADRPTADPEEIPVPETTPSPLRATIGDLAPKIVQLTEDVLFGDVWERPELGKRDRSLLTLSSLLTGGSTVQLESHTRIGRENGLTEAEIVEAFTHLAFYAGWPKALSAIDVAKRVFAE